MKKFILTVLCPAIAAGCVTAAPAPPMPKGPSADAIKAVEGRRERLRQIEFLTRENLNPEQLAELDRKVEPALRDLAEAIGSRDPFIYDEAVRDIINSNYRALASNKIAALLLPRVRKPETTPAGISTQGWVLEWLRRKDARPAARAAVPDLLQWVASNEVNDYLRGQAIDTLAAIAPGETEVVKAFIAALENPNPKSSSGIHDRVAERLGEMGRVAAPAKKALISIFDRGEWYQDPAYIALGRITRDEKPRALADYLKRWQSIDRIPIDQAAAAFLHVVELASTGKKQWVGKPPRQQEIMNAEVVRAARPVLLQIIEDRQADVHSRAALRTLCELGPGGSPQTAQLLTNLLFKYRDRLESLRKELATLDAGPKREALIKEITQAYSSRRESLLLEAIDRMETSDAATAVALAESFSRQIESKDDSRLAQRLAKKLAQFGTVARPAVPAAIKALRDFPVTRERDLYIEAFSDYLSVLTAAGGEASGVRRTIVELLDPSGNLLQKSGVNAPTFQVKLFVTLGSTGLPGDVADRQLALKRIQEGLGSDIAEVFSAACVAVTGEKKFKKDESGPLVKALAQVVEPEFTFRPLTQESTRHLKWIFAPDEQRLIGQGMALRALSALGPLAVDALPAVKRVASQNLQKHASDFMPEPAGNIVIREAGRAQKQIEARE